MPKTTITEALAELKTIDKRVEKKREFIHSYIGRQEVVRDPLEKDGGSVSAVAAELQGIGDLQERTLLIRRAVADANIKHKITVEEETRSIADWLVWRREVAPKQKALWDSLARAIQALRAEAKKRDMTVSTAGESSSGKDYIINLSESKLAKDIERLELVLGTLDGQLSLKNATITIEV